MQTSSLRPISSSPAGTDGSPRRVVGLDSIRFVCAFLVMLGHIGFVHNQPHGNGLNILRLVVSLQNAVFNGPAAVIVFFLISGFCIHFPFNNKRPLAPGPFYVRRFIRILPPAILFFLFFHYVLKDAESLHDTVLWSIVCEAIYYLLYPALLYLRRISNWPTLIGLSFGLAAVIIATHTGSLSRGAYGYPALEWATWAIGLPCWLLGCWLAENYHSFPLLSPRQMWLLRSAIFVSTILLQLIRFHVHSIVASNCILLDLFAFPAYLWLGLEIAYTAEHPPSRVLEQAGGWSYSLYLIHPLVASTFALIGLESLDLRPQTHFLLLIVALLASYVFYLLCERPCHHLAVLAGRALSPAPRTRAVAPVPIPNHPMEVLLLEQQPAAVETAGQQR